MDKATGKTIGSTAGLVLLALAAIPALTNPPDGYREREIHQASALVPWCR